MNIVELVAVISGLAYVILAARSIILCWLFGGVSAAIYAYLTFQANLFAEFALQLFYVIISVYGFRQWNKHKGINTVKEIKVFTLKQNAIFTAVAALFTLLVAKFLDRFTTSELVYLDAFTTVFSLFTTYLVAQRVLQNWLYWIVIDLAAAVMYFIKGFELTAVLYLLYTALALFGFLQWRNRLSSL